MAHAGAGKDAGAPSVNEGEEGAGASSSPPSGGGGLSRALRCVDSCECEKGRKLLSRSSASSLCLADATRLPFPTQLNPTRLNNVLAAVAHTRTHPGTNECRGWGEQLQEVVEIIAPGPIEVEDRRAARSKVDAAVRRSRALSPR